MTVNWLNEQYASIVGKQRQSKTTSFIVLYAMNWEKFQILNRLSWLAFGKVMSMEKATGYYHV